uniref:Armadillo-type protein n=1 Tax=Syphacia muris TaxID=451379 RepID=A0A0N5ARR1_9BILA
MNVIFQDTLRTPLQQSSAPSQPFCPSRQFVDQFKRFIQSNDPTLTASSSSSGFSLSDVGFLLLRLKDQLLSSDQRGAYFPAEFVARPNNGVDLLIKVVVALQNIVNSIGSSSKLSSLLPRTNSSTNRRRKAAPAAWRSLLETPGNLDVILYSVHSPQLDSKCYALEIIILLLDQPRGFVILFRSLSYICARNRDYLRLSIFVAQLKHGLHTSKLHIQILVVRLLNKLLQQAPSPAHRIMAQTDAVLSNFSPEYLEKLVVDATTPLGGTETLMEEIAVWKSLYTQIVIRRERGLAPVNHHNPAINFTYAEPDTDTTRSEQDRRRMNMKLSGQTSVTKNVERQRLKKHGDGYESNSHLSSRMNGNINAYYPSQTMTKAWDSHNAYPQSRYERTDVFERPDFGGMRRAKSESTMAIEDDSFSRCIKQANGYPDRRRAELTSKLSRSIHDLSREQPINEVRPGSATMTRSLRRITSPPRARFAEPLVDNKPAAIQGFSYLFPTQPIISNVSTKQRSRTPDPYKENGIKNVAYSGQQLQRPPSAPVFESPHSPPDYETDTYSLQPKTNGHSEKVVYIPINTPTDGQIRTLPRTNADGSTNLRRYDYRRQLDTVADEYSLESRSSSTSRLRSPSSYTGTIGDDIKDALSQFDYLNDYDAASIRGMPSSQTKCTPTTYHF